MAAVVWTSTSRSGATTNGITDHGGMATIADLRAGRSPHAALLAAGSAFAPTTISAWVSWQALEGGRDTLLASQLPQWALLSGGAAALTCVAAGVFWRAPNVHLGVVIGVLLATLAVLSGLLVDVVGSGGLA
jgi:hypothetical protein